MNNLNEETVVPLVVDFAEARKNGINESWLRSFATLIKMMLSGLLDGIKVPVKVVGTKKEIDSFANTISAERDYISSFRKYGLDNPATYRTRSTLDSKVKRFERDTGLKWPFK